MVNRERCLDEVRAAIKILVKKGGAGCILHRELRSNNKIVQRGKRVPRTHQFISFDAVLAALDYVAFDKYFQVGRSVYERKDGLAMGNSTSPALTSFDLDEHGRKIYSDVRFAKSTGAHVAGMSTAKAIQCLLHVDDCLAMSKVHCEACLARIIQRTWPRDVSTKLEASGSDIEFLHLRVQAAENSIVTSQVKLSPLIPNEAFCEGKTHAPKMAKCQQFVPGVHKAHHLEAILWGKLSIIVNTNKNDMGTARKAVACAFVEPILLGWCPRTVGLTAANLPKSHRGQTANFIRLVGQTIKKSRSILHAWSKPYDDQNVRIGAPWWDLINAACDFAIHRMCRSTGALPP
jgi:hypothetical protein